MWPKNVNLRHGHSRRGKRAKEYMIWASMLARCENQKDKRFDKYGGRGITVCSAWHDFAQFIADVGLKPSPEYSLDRINNDGNYEPSNCRWATRLEQANNSSRNHKLTLGQCSKTISEWSRETGIQAGKILSRIRAGWTTERALTP